MAYRPAYGAGVLPLITKYNGIVAAGNGLPAVRASGRATGQTAANTSICTYTPTAEGSFDIVMNLLVTTSTTYNFVMKCTHTDEQSGGTRGCYIFYTLVAGGAPATAIAQADGAVPRMGIVARIRSAAGTSITCSTHAAGGNFTSVTYNVEASIIQVS